jgi:hypothetical protein
MDAACGDATAGAFASSDFCLSGATEPLGSADWASAGLEGRGAVSAMETEGAAGNPWLSEPCVAKNGKKDSAKLSTIDSIGTRYAPLQKYYFKFSGPLVNWTLVQYSFLPGQ